MDGAFGWDDFYCVDLGKDESRIKSIFLKILKIIFAFFFFELSFNNCSYDQTLIYKKDYLVGKNTLLGLNGFYFNKTSPTIYDTTEYLYPIFFYSDGSVILMGALKDTFQLGNRIRQNPKAIWGTWGNYKIKDDTILIETLEPYPTGDSFRHKRVIKKGTLMKDRLYFLSESWNEGPTKEIKKEVSFVYFNLKPDSTENWIRKKKRFN